MPDNTRPLLPHILLVNDDGIHAEGIKTLYSGLQDLARITVVAPETEQSARSQAITLFSPLSFTRYAEDGRIIGYAVQGTPVDCVKIALKVILRNDWPDLIISGINEGANTGVNVLYSGTVGAALEGALHEIPSIALSVTSKGRVNFKPALKIARDVIAMLKNGELDDLPLLNINVPNVKDESELMGIRRTSMAQSLWNDDFEKRISPQGREYYWMKGHKFSHDESIDSDEGAVIRKYISITPLHYNMTDHQRLKLLEKLSIFDSEQTEI